MKKLAILLALCLMLSALPAGMLAEEGQAVISESAEVVIGETEKAPADEPAQPADEPAQPAAEEPAQPAAEEPAQPAAEPQAPADADAPREAVGETGAEGLIAEPEGDAPDDAYDLMQYEQGEEIDSDAALAEQQGENAVDAPVTGEELVPAPHTDPNGPQLSVNWSTLGVGETLALARTLPAGVGGGITYQSSNASVASVGADGVVSALAPGKVTITATAENAAYAECFVTVKSAPDKVSFAAPTFTLGKGESTAAIQVVLGSDPSQCAGSYTLTSSKKKVVSVDENGMLHGLKTGKAVLTVTTYNGLTAQCSVNVLKAPKKVLCEVDKPMMGVGETGQASYVLPKKTASQVIYASENPSVVAIDAATGKMTAVAAGTARIRVTTYNGKTDAADVIVGNAPVTLTFPSDQFVMGVGMSASSAAMVNEGAAAGIQYSFSAPGIASFEKGVIKALNVGQTTLTATTYNGLTASCNLVVKPKPAYVRLPYKTLTVGVGQSIQLTPDVGDSASTFTYSTSAKKRVAVSADGVVTGLAKGKATVTVKTYNKKKCKVKVIVVNQPVVTDVPEPPQGDPQTVAADVVLTIPARTTDVAGIAGNLAKIDAIRVCAIQQIETLRSSGIISDSDAAKRKSMVNNAFADYAFPWMTPAYQAYWKAANSEGGVKDFQPDRVYYGLPYISGSGANRLYNAARALSEGRYTDGGSGYYLLNQGNLLNKKYCGNDCSGFVGAAIWGVGNKHSADRTTDIARSSNYITISGFDDMRTGDLICKSDAHVVMFLYYTSPDKSSFMIIENGGAEPGTNTVHCIIMDTAYYQLKGYSVRRLASLG